MKKYAYMERNRKKGESSLIFLFFLEVLMQEKDFQKKLIKEIRERFPDCEVLKNDANYKQGIPDLVIFYKKHWAMLEVKKDSKATHRPNQDLRIEKYDKMSFARIIFPENKEEVLDALERSFKGHTRRNTCVSRSK